jgi:hypothetical protein
LLYFIIVSATGCAWTLAGLIFSRRREFPECEHADQLLADSLDRPDGAGIEAHRVQGRSIESTSCRIFEEIEAQEEVRGSRGPLACILRTQCSVGQADISFRGQRSEKSPALCAAATLRFDQQTGNPRRDGKLEHAPARLGELACGLVIHCTELDEQALGAGEGCFGRCVEPGKTAWVSEAPASQLEHGATQVQAQHFRGLLSAEAGVLSTRPQAQAPTRCDASSTTCALVGRRATY